MTPEPPQTPMGRVILRRQLTIWTVFASLYFAFDSGRQELPAGTELFDLVGLFVRSLVWGLVGCVVSTLLLCAYTRVHVYTQERSSYVKMMFGALLASLVYLFSFHGLDALLGLEDGWVRFEHWSQSQFFGEWFDYLLFMLAWHGIILTLTRQEQLHHERERVLRVEKLAEQSKIAMLRYQLDPHFLFNSLNSAIALVDEDPRATQEMLTRLSHLLRERLDGSMDVTSSLQRELEMIRHYIAVESVRFEEKLQVQENVEPLALPRPLPPFILQPLLENAIHHGMRTSTPPLYITLDISLDEEDALVVTLWNSGVWRPGQGIGLSNVRDRLAAELNDHSFEIGPAGEGVLATLRVPREAYDER